MADPFRLVFNRAELDRLLESEQGPVGLDIAKKTARAANSARRRAPRRSGELRSNIGWEIGHDGAGLFGDVISRRDKFQEKGHVAANGRRVAPRRYLRPALRALRRSR